MTKSRKKRQRFEDSIADHPNSESYFIAKSQFLERKYKEHKVDIYALKAHINRFKSIVVDMIKDCDGGGDEVPLTLLDAYDATPEQSLAQHDKQVKIDVLEDFRCQLPMAFVEDLDEYIRQIKEQ